MHTPGSYYKFSGEFRLEPLISTTLTGIALAFLIGFLYATLSYVSPSDYLDFLLLGGAMYACAIAFSRVRLASESRNTLVNNIVSIMLCYLAWSSQWAIFSLYKGYKVSFLGGIFNPSITFDMIAARVQEIDGYPHSHRSNLSNFPFGGASAMFCYIVEMGAFAIAMLSLVGRTRYFCEDCMKFYSRRELFIMNADNFHLLKDQTGPDHHYQFLPQLVFSKQLPTVITDKRSVIAIELYFCSECYENNILDVSAFSLEKDSQRKDTINRVEEETITTGMYIEKDTADALHRRFL